MGQAMTTTAALDDWRTQHLFLLIGGNPLPNYVAGSLLLSTEGTLHLVHSPDTREMADRIGKRLGN